MPDANKTMAPFGAIVVFSLYMLALSAYIIKRGASSIRFVKDADGEWVGKFSEGYDQAFHLVDEVTGKPLANRCYRMIFNGEVLEGKTDKEGRTSKVIADDPGEVQIEVFPGGYDGSGA